MLDEPVDFFEWVTGYKPYDYQVNILNCKDKRIAIRSGRQVGKTTVCAIKSLYEAFWNKNKQILIIAPVRKQSKLLFQVIKDCITLKTELSKSLVKDTATEMFFDNGSRIYCETGAILSKDRIRGFSPNIVIVDEAAFVADETFSSTEPSVIKTQGSIILTSTPYGKRGFFYETFLPNSDYTKFHIKSEECPHILKKELDKLKNRLTKNEYVQEYEGEFTEEGDEYFTKELIKDCTDSNIKEIDTPETGRHYYLGVDCARFGQDETVYIIRDDLGKVIKILFDKMQPSTVVIEKIKYLNNVYKIQNINIDEAGTGGAVYDILFKEGLPIMPHTFSITGKEKIYRNLKSLMEHGKIKYPNNQKLIQQMENLTKTFTIQGTRIQPPLGGHNDYPDALALTFKDMQVMMEEDSGKDEWFIG